MCGLVFTFPAERREVKPRHPWPRRRALA